MRYIVDRIEGHIAVLERDDLVFIDVPLSELPREVKAGDCLERVDGMWAFDRKRTKERRSRLEQLMKAAFVR